MNRAKGEKVLGPSKRTLFSFSSCSPWKQSSPARRLSHSERHSAVYTTASINHEYTRLHLSTMSIHDCIYQPWVYTTASINHEYTRLHLSIMSIHDCIYQPGVYTTASINHEYTRLHLSTMSIHDCIYQPGVYTTASINHEYTRLHLSTMSIHDCIYQSVYRPLFVWVKLMLWCKKKSFLSQCISIYLSIYIYMFCVCPVTAAGLSLLSLSSFAYI